MAFGDTLRDALEELLNDPEYTLPYDSLPLDDLDQHIDLSVQSRATEALVRKSTKPNELEAVPNVYAFRDSAVANMGTGAFTAVAWTNEVRDQGNMLNIATQPTRLVAPIQGIYLVTATIFFAAGGGANRITAFTINGAGQRWFAGSADVTANSRSQATGLLWLNRGDYFEVVGFQDSGGATTSDSNGTDTTEVGAVWVSNFNSDQLTDPQAP